MNKYEKEEIIKNGRIELFNWLTAAEAHGKIYYHIPSVSRSGMSRTISMRTIKVDLKEDKIDLVRLWPSLPYDGQLKFPEYNLALDLVAKDWHFSFKKRAFEVGGCGMDMVFAQIDYLAHLAGITDGYANRVRHEEF